jgi:hypothetical protein
VHAYHEAHLFLEAPGAKAGQVSPTFLFREKPDQTPVLVMVLNILENVVTNSCCPISWRGIRRFVLSERIHAADFEGYKSEVWRDEHDVKPV